MKIVTKLSALILFSVVGVLASTSSAQAQPYGGGYYGGRHEWRRPGRLTVGLNLGFGGMSSANNAITCDTCDYKPASLEIGGHIGVMLTNRLALELELQGNAQQIGADSQGDTTTLVQSTALVALQAWLTPQFWLKGGLGGSNLSVTSQDAFGNGVNDPVAHGSGGAVLLAAGYELLSAPRFSVDLQGRLLFTTYDGLNDKITAGTIGVGVNWF